MTLHDLEAGVKDHIWHLQKDLQTTISRKLFSHSKPIMTKITLKQAFLAIYILWKSDVASCNILYCRTCQWFSNNQLWRPFFFIMRNFFFFFLQTCFHSHNHSLQIWWRYFHKWMRQNSWFKKVTKIHMIHVTQYAEDELKIRQSTEISWEYLNSCVNYC